MYSFGYLLKEGVRSLWNNRTMTLASICVLISCLLLTGTAVLLTMNMSSAMGMVEETNSVTVYLEDDLPALTAVTTPLLTVATDLSEVCHTTVLLEAFSGSTVAVRVAVSSTSKVTDFLFNVIPVTGMYV